MRAMFAGLSRGTITMSRFRANVVRAVRPGSFDTRSSHLGAADANKSTGAPCWICIASALDDEKVNRTASPGCALSKAAPMRWKTCEREAAAATVIRCDGEADDDEHATATSRPVADNARKRP